MATKEIASGHIRSRVILFAATLAALTYVDRVCVSQLEPDIRRDLHLTKEQMGYVYAAFTWGYALFEVPGGWLGDRIGARSVLTRVVIWWSFFTAATGCAWSRGSLIVTRFLFGAGEAGCFPNLTKALKTWLSESERVRGQSIVWLSARWGGAFTPLLVALLMKFLNWRVTMALLGSLGIVWAVLFHRWYRDRPRDPASVGAPTPLAGPTPWKRILGSPRVALLCLQYMFLNYAWFFYVTWLPTYLRDGRGVKDEDLAALLAALPLLFGGMGCLASGFISPLVSRWTGSVRTARRAIACAGFGCAAILLLVSIRIPDPRWAMVVLGLAGFSNDFAMPVSWVACMDMGGRHTGTLSGIMNMMGAPAAGLGSIVTGAILERGGSWELTFYISAVLYMLGLIAWLLLDPVTPLVPDEDPGPEEENS